MGEEKKYLKLYHKLAYGSGDFGANFCYTFVSSFVMIYLTNTVGLNSGIIGTLMLVSRVLDGITDVASGTIIDRTKSRLGKARFWMLSMIPFIAISEILLFNIPGSAGSVLPYAYFFIVYTLLNDIFYTMSNVAYSTLSMLITKNKSERVQLGAFRYIGTAIAATVINSVTMNLVEYFGGGAQGWRVTAIIYAVIFAVVNVVCVAPLREVNISGDDSAEDNAVKAEKSQNGLIDNIRYLIKNKYFLLLLASQILISIFGNIFVASGVYYTTYILGNASLLGAFSMTMMAYLIGLVVSPFLVAKIGIYKTNLYSMVLVVLADIGFILVSVMTQNVTLMIVFSSLRWIFSGPFTGNTAALTAEVGQFSLLRDHTHVEASTFSCTSMGNKVGAGLASTLVGWCLAIGKFDGLAEVQPASAQGMISFLFVWIPLIFHALVLIILYFLKVEQANKKLMETSEK